MESRERVRIYLGIGALLAAGGGIYLLFPMIADRDWAWSISAALYLLGVGFSGWGMWQWRGWALKLSWLLALATFGFSCYVAHFRWTFWLFETPTFWKRVLALFHPVVILPLVGSLLWLNYFVRPGVRKEFQ